MASQRLLNFLNELENTKNLSLDAKNKILDFIDHHRIKHIILMLFVALLGVGFIFFGFYHIFREKWPQIPSYIRLFLGLAPFGICLWIYIHSRRKKSDRPLWNEASGIFLFLSIGFAIRVFLNTQGIPFAQHYFFALWLLLTLPILYIGRPIAVLFLYASLTISFIVPTISFAQGLIVNSNYLWFWLFFLAYFPRFLLDIDWNNQYQKLSTVLNGYCYLFFLFLLSGLALPSGHIFWLPVFYFVSYILGKFYFSKNASAWHRPLQTFSIFAVGLSLVSLSFNQSWDLILYAVNLKNIGNWNPLKLSGHLLGFSALLSCCIYGIRQQKKSLALNRYILFFPTIILLSFVLFSFEKVDLIDLRWLALILISFTALFYSIHAIIKGYRSEDFAYLYFGFILLALLCLLKTLNWTGNVYLRGSALIIVGGIFLGINWIIGEGFDTKKTTGTKDINRHQFDS